MLSLLRFGGGSGDGDEGSRSKQIESGLERIGPSPATKGVKGVTVVDCMYEVLKKP